jgi:hypothetical protein
LPAACPSSPIAEETPANNNTSKVDREAEGEGEGGRGRGRGRRRGGGREAAFLIFVVQSQKK